MEVKKCGIWVLVRACECGYNFITLLFRVSEITSVELRIRRAALTSRWAVCILMVQGAHFATLVGKVVVNKYSVLI